MVNINKDFLDLHDKNKFTQDVKNELTSRVFVELEDIKRIMAKDYLKRDEDESQ